MTNTWEILLVLLCLVWTSRTITCPSDDNCLCLPGPEYEFQCPKNTYGLEFVIHVDDTRISIDCSDSLEKFAISHLPNIEIHKIEKFLIRFCPPPENGFRSILDKFQTEEVKFFSYDLSTRNVILSKDSFQGFQFLEGLELDAVGLVDLEGNVFVNTPNLTSLSLQRNSIRLRQDLFKYTPLLTFLDISENHIRSIPEGLFQGLNQLEFLHLWGNDLIEINDSTFQGLENLKTLELSFNRIELVPENALKSTPNLITVNFRRNKLKTLPLFGSLDKLEVLILSQNNLTHISHLTFQGLRNLKSLDLSFNRIETLQTNQTNLFHGLVNLEKLDLSHNKIVEVSGLTSLKKLKYLLLDNNLITAIDQRSFKNLDSLEEISLQENKIRVVDDSMFYYAQNLEKIHLSYNEITDIRIANILKSKHKLKYLDLSHNYISFIKVKDLESYYSTVSIDLKYNNITTISVQNVDVIRSHKSLSRVFLSHNPLQCDCSNYDFIRYFRSDVVATITNNLVCGGPPEMKDVEIKKVSPEEIFCPLAKICPKECFCNWQPYNNLLVVNCTKRNLDNFPKINLEESSIVFDEIEVHLEDNFLTDLACYQNVTKLYLSRNNIKEVVRFPPSLKLLHLDDNKISHLDDEVLQNLQTSTLTDLSLGGNPWSCNCDAANFVNFIRQYIDKVDVGKIRCLNADLLLVNLDERDLCYEWSLIALCVVLLVVIFIIFLFPFKKKLMTHVWSTKRGLSESEVFVEDRNQKL